MTMTFKRLLFVGAMVLALALSAAIHVAQPAQGQDDNPLAPWTWVFDYRTRSAEHVGGDVIATTFAEYADVFDFESGDLLHSFAHGADVYFVAASPDGTTLATSTYYDEDDHYNVHVWDIASGEKRWALTTEPEHQTQDLAFSPDNRHLAAGHYGQVSVWDVTTGELVHALQVPPDREGKFVAVDFSADGQYIAGVLDTKHGWPQQVLVWDLATGETILQYEREEALLKSVRFSPDGRHLAVGMLAVDLPATVDIVDLISGQRVQQIQQPPDDDSGIDNLAYSPDGRYLLTAGYRTVYVWDTATQELVTSWRSFFDNRVGVINDLDFSADGRYFLMAAGSGLFIMQDEPLFALAEPAFAACEGTISADVLGVFLRAEPDPGAESLATIPGGAAITVTAQQGDWFAVEYEGVSGWITGEALEGCP